MANLRGVVVSDRNTSEATRLGDSLMGASLHTWEDNIRTTLAEDGIFTVTINGVKVLSGNIKDYRERI